MNALAFLRRRKSLSLWLGLGIAAPLLVLAVVGPFLLPNDPFQVNYDQMLQPGFWAKDSRFPLGTDGLGRCIASRLILGSRPTLGWAVFAVGFALVLGVFLGTMVYVNRRLDEVVMRAMDVMLAFPPILLAVVVVAVLGSGLRNTALAIGLVNAPSMARVVRSQVLSLMEIPFVEAAVSIGASRPYILVRHILPNLLATVLVYATLLTGSSMLAIASMSFLGLGPPPPSPEWGLMLMDSRQLVLAGAWWAFTFPGLAIMLAVLGLNLLGDGIRDALDPRLLNKR